VTARWETLARQKRECKYYRLTPLGRKQLATEQSKWNRLTGAIAAVLSGAKA
jgi:DNA-binding PadR family transcriptional regulator